jgi:hypothetical protein
MQCSKKDRYSITSSARLCTDCGTVMPSALPVFRLTISSIFVGAPAFAATPQKREKPDYT